MMKKRRRVVEVRAASATNRDDGSMRMRMSRDC